MVFPQIKAKTCNALSVKNNETARKIRGFFTQHIGPLRLLYLIPMQVGVFLMSLQAFFPGWKVCENELWFTGLALFSLSSYLLNPRVGRVAVPVFIILLILFGILP